MNTSDNAWGKSREALRFRAETRQGDRKERNRDYDGVWSVMPGKAFLGETTSWFPKEKPRQTRRGKDPVVAGLLTGTASLWRTWGGTEGRWKGCREMWHW